MAAAAVRDSAKRKDATVPTRKVYSYEDVEIEYAPGHKPAYEVSAQVWPDPGGRYAKYIPGMHEYKMCREQPPLYQKGSFHYWLDDYLLLF